MDDIKRSEVICLAFGSPVNAALVSSHALSICLLYVVFFFLPPPVSCSQIGDLSPAMNLFSFSFFFHGNEMEGQGMDDLVS